MPPNSRQSIRGGFFDKYLPASQIYDDVTVENLHDAYAIAEANAQDEYR